MATKEELLAQLTEELRAIYTQRRIPNQAAQNTPNELANINAQREQDISNIVSQSSRRPSVVEALLTGAGRGSVFSAPEHAQAAIDPLRDIEATRARNDEIAKQRPIAYGLGYGGGAVSTGGGVAKVLSKVPGLAFEKPLEGLARTAGPTIRNTARLMGLGGGEAAGQTLGEGGSAEDAALVGALGAFAGPLAGPLVRGVAGGARLGGRIFRGPLKNAVRIISKRLGNTIEDVETALTNFIRDTKRMPSLAEISEPNFVEEMAQIGRQKQVAGQIFREARERTTSVRPGALESNIRSRGPTTTPSAGRGARTARGDVLFGVIADSPVRLTQDDFDFLLHDADVYQALPRPLKRIIAEADHSSNKEITMRQLDDMRQAFGNRVGPGDAQRYAEYADEVREIGVRNIPEYGATIDAFAADSRRITGFERARTGKLPQNATSATDRAALATPEGAEGTAIGTRTRLAESSGASESGAIQTADELRQEASQPRLQEALGINEARALQRAGAAEIRSARQLNQLASSPAAKSAETARMIQTASEAVVTAGGKALTGFKVHFFNRLVSNPLITTNTARRLAELVSDPAELPGLLQALRNAHLTENQIRELFIPGLAGTAGITLGGSAQ
jgi:hypothetical protein